MAFEEHQEKDKYIIYDLGQEIALDQFEIYLHDSNLDFIYDGIVSHSTDKENWTEFLTIGDQQPNPNANGNINDSYPNHKISYNTIEKRGIDARARYIKIDITQNVNRWVQFNEIMINDGEYLKVDNDARFEASVIEERGGEAPNLVDGNLNTMYIPSDKNGSLKYHLSEKHDAQTLTILQSENTLSKAVVKARIAPKNNPSNSEVVELGQLSQSLNKFQLPNEYLIYDIEIVWGDVIPHLYELTLTNEDVEEVNKTALKAAIAKEVNENWTKSSKETYQKALDLAKEIDANSYASQQAVDSAINHLENAFNNAEMKGDPELLQKEVDEAKTNDKDLYTSASWNKLANAIADAEKQLKDLEDLSVADVDQAIKQIQQAIEALTFEVVSKENAMIAVEDAETLITSIENPDKVYTNSSFNAFTAAISTIKDLLLQNQETPIMPTVFKEATDVLFDTREKLVDATALYILLDEFVEEYEGNEAAYTTESFTAYKATIETAKVIVANGSEEEVQTAIENVKTTRAALEVKQETTLEELVESLSNKEVKNYTADSFTAFEEVLNEAKALLESEEATEEELDEMKEQLNQASKGLVSIKELNVKLQQVDQFDEGKYTKASYDALVEALTQIEKDEVTKSGSDEEVQQAVAAIAGAIEQLVLAADQDELNKLITEMQKVHVDDYPKATAEPFDGALQALIELQKNENATATEFAQAKAAMQDAKDMLISVKALNEAVAKVESLNPDEYTKSSFEHVLKVSKSVEKLFVDGSEVDIKAAVKKLEEALNGLLKVADYEAAKVAVEKASTSLKRADLDAAQQVVNALPNSPEKNQLVKQLEVIAEMIKILEENDEGEPGDNNNNGSTGQKPGNDGNNNNNGSLPGNNGNDGNNGTKPGNNGSTGTDSGKGQTNNNKLPSTATNTGSIMLIGFLIFGLASILFIIGRKKKSTNELK